MLTFSNFILLRVVLHTAAPNAKLMINFGNVSQLSQLPTSTSAVVTECHYLIFIRACVCITFSSRYSKQFVSNKLSCYLTAGLWLRAGLPTYYALPEKLRLLCRTLLGPCNIRLRFVPSQCVLVKAALGRIIWPLVLVKIMMRDGHKRTRAWIGIFKYLHYS